MLDARNIAIRFGLYLMLCGGPTLAADDILLADFEGADYGDWQVTGVAFGPGPARGTLAHQMPVSGYEGNGLVNSYYGQDKTTGTLTSPAFVVQRRYLNFLLGGGYHPGEATMNLLVDAKVVRQATGTNDRPGGTERLEWYHWDLEEFVGKQATIQIVDTATGGWGHINVDHILLSDTARGILAVAEGPEQAPLYEERHRPQFHFTARKNWINDPNGLVYFAGEYHLFFQHNPTGIEWGNMTWGHAVSPDLVHWEQLDHALYPDSLGTIFSGSAVIDWQNTAGFQTGDEPAMIAIYTSAGGQSPESAGKLFTQSIAYSNDRGRTWTKYAGNPVLDWIIGGNRDPKVVWHEPTRRWIMALYMDGEQFALFASPDLRLWSHLQDVILPETTEVPDFFELPVDGVDDTRWVYWGANGRYLLGTFDGHQFTTTSGPHKAEFGGNYYAAQSWSDVPDIDGRRLQIGWLTGGSYPRMPFNQQLSVPRELRLRRTEDGIRLFSLPVREIAQLRETTHRWAHRALPAGEDLLEGINADLVEIVADIEPGAARAIRFDLRGGQVSYDVGNQQLTALDRTASVGLVDGRLRLHILLDRASLEVFAENGLVPMAITWLPSTDRSLNLEAVGGTAQVVSLEVHTLRSAWRTTPRPTAVEQEASTPTDFALEAAHPNPFNSDVTLWYRLSSTGSRVLRVYSVTGQLVRSLADGLEAAGRHRVVWDGTDDRGRQVSSGVYFISLQMSARQDIGKVLLLR